VELNKIIHGDAYELIKELPDKSVDLIYTDPPFEYEGSFGDRLLTQGRITESTHNHIQQMSKGITRALLDEFVRVCKYVYIYIWCNEKQIPFYLDYFVKEKGCDFKILGFHKTNPMPMYSKRYLDDIEYCLFFVEKGKQKFYGTDTYTNSFKIYSAPINTYDKNKYKHASIKPYQCVKNHIEKTCKKGMIVLDPFAGSATTLKVCQDLGIDFLGFEIDNYWWQVGTDRLNGIDSNGNGILFDL